MKKRTFVGLGIAALLFATVLPSAQGAVNASPSPSATNPYGAGKIDPAGPNESILTISNGSMSKKFRMKDLVALRPTVLSIYEPFVKKRQNFTVIPLSTFFNQVKIKADASVVTRALNDYVYTNKASEFTSAKGYLAIKRDGVDIPYDQGGPIRLVYPDSSKWAKSLDPWNWSLSSISVKK